jgi:Flp pilus assembly protein TadD
MEAAVPEPLELFISYAHEDDLLREELVKHLTQLRKDGLIKEWHDRRLTGGTEWAGRIDEHLNSAHIIVLLVSPDFLASQYCYDVELTRALQRHEQGEARVVPVILRPCDWHSAPFGKLNALPRDGKPVVDWPTRDHGLLNVTEGLRRTVQELRPHADPLKPATKPSHQPARGRITRPSTRTLVIAAAITVILGAAAAQWWAAERSYLNDGEALLNVGRYEDAIGPFRNALRLNPLSGPAKRGVEIAELAKLRSDPVVFGQRLQNAVARSPHDDHLNVLYGDYLLAQGEEKAAMTHYQESVKRNPNLAEAFFRMGVLYDQSQLRGRALAMYERAVKLGPSSPQYRNNLADAYFKHGQYDSAIKEYGSIIDQFPLAPLEMARIYRLMGRLDEALERETAAIEWLENDAVMSRPENLQPWYFEVDGNTAVSIPSRNQKLCYARLSVAATTYLKGDVAASDTAWNRGAQACGSQTLYVREVLDHELGQLADERDELAIKVSDFRKRLRPGQG